MPAGTIPNKHEQHQYHHVPRVQIGNSLAVRQVFLFLKYAVKAHADFVTFSQNRLIELHLFMPPGASQA